MTSLSQRRRILAALVGATLAVSAISAATQAAAAPASAIPDPSAALAQVWLTTPDGSQRMAQQQPVAFTDYTPRPGDPLTITVDPSLRYQQLDGVGASITDSSAGVLYELDPATRAATMRDLFADNGFSFLRQPLGSSDFVDGPHYTYDDLPAGQTDYGLQHFSIVHDTAKILPLLRQALQLNPRLKVIGTPWSPPAWMKTSGSLVGGRLIDDERIYTAYANYLVKAVQAYRAQGVPLYGLTIQNEPQNRHPLEYPGTDLPPEQAIKVIDRLGPALRRAGLNTKIMGYDHNWSLHPNDAAGAPSGEDPHSEYPTDLLTSSAAKWLAGTAFHCYYGDPARMTQLHRAFPDRDIWFTECSGSHGASDPPAQVFSDTLKWHARTITVGVPRNWAKSVVTWNLALHPDGTPHNGGCDTCTGVVAVEPDGTVTRNAEYYTLGHLARFVQPGAWRIASSGYGSTGWNGLTTDVAFSNPDGSTVLVAHNEYDDPRPVLVAVGDRAFNYTIPGGSLATFVWSGRYHGDTLIDPWTTAVTAGSGGAAGAAAPAAADDDGATAWSTGGAQQAGQWLQVDLGRKWSTRSLVLDAGPATYGWPNTGAGSQSAPRAYRVEVSKDGTRWEAAGIGSSAQQLTTITLPRTAIRYVRVVLTAATAAWWQVAEVRVYR